MDERYIRTAMMLGSDAVTRLIGSRVAVFGVGGVGGFAVEAIARAGVGEIHLFDSDKVSRSNINRQIIALESTVGEYKTEAMKKRILDINPTASVFCYNIFVGEDNLCDIDFSAFDYVVDAIDSVRSKVALIAAAHNAGAPIISAMGAGNKLDPTRFEVSDISKTSVCPLARAVRTSLRRLGINHLKVVYSKELPVEKEDVSTEDRGAPGSVSFVPSVMGLILASEVIKDIANKNE